MYQSSSSLKEATKGKLKQPKPNAKALTEVYWP